MKLLSNRMADEEAVYNQRKRYMELAGMLKEKGSGHLKTLKRIVARFALQEGISGVKAKKYLLLLEESDLVVLSGGRKMWRYNSDAEWELFKVTI